MHHPAGSGTLKAPKEVNPMPLIHRPGGPRRRRAFVLGAVLLAVALVVTGCSGSSKAPPGTTAPARPATPTKYPLTGLKAEDPAVAVRPALSVKVENVAAARPQAGLNAADLVAEQLVEGGLTRLMVTFQSRDAALVGPVRSVRPVDAPLLRELGGGLFAFSGGSVGVLAEVRRSSDATFLEPGRAAGAYRRVAGRPAPHNLFTSTEALYQAGRQVDGRLGPPPQLFTYADAPPAGARPVTRARLRFSPSSRAAWQWDAGNERFVRYQDGTLSRLQDRSPVSTENVVILSVAIGTTSNVDVAGNHTPDVVVTGEGSAWVLRDGKLVSGTWRRPSASGPVRLVGSDGAPIPLRPGRTWMELLPSRERPAFG
jgi:Protein of unknown function (DUF3048) N-terminal domain/Protein of unknown function (DUF3048) C-terminal domain